MTMVTFLTSRSALCTLLMRSSLSASSLRGPPIGMCATRFPFLTRRLCLRLANRTHMNEIRMNLHILHPNDIYSPECVEVEFSEVRIP